MDNETKLAGKKLIDQQDVYGYLARNLTAELHHDMNAVIKMYYQPQYDYDGNCVGTEALLRWEHPMFGMMYPPLLIKLAEDGGFLPELEEQIVNKVISDADKVREKFGENLKISFNVTGTTVVTDRFWQFCDSLSRKQTFKGSNICIEVTEQATLEFDDKTLKALQHLKEMGLKLTIDDFSMGHTSIQYLKNNLFDYIKLDGSLVQGLSKYENCREIISSIVQLSESLHMDVIAEFVETEEQREELHQLGCDCYQGWLYSPAVPLDQ